MCRYSPKNPSLVSETVHYKRGVSQQFSMPSFKIDFSEWKEEDVSFCKSLWSLLLDHTSQHPIFSWFMSVSFLCQRSTSVYQHNVWLLQSSVYNLPSLNNKIYLCLPLKLNFDLDRGVFPMVIQAVVDEGDGRLLELHYSQDSISFLLRLAVQT